MMLHEEHVPTHALVAGQAEGSPPKVLRKPPAPSKVMTAAPVSPDYPHRDPKTERPLRPSSVGLFFVFAAMSMIGDLPVP